MIDKYNEERKRCEELLEKTIQQKLEIVTSDELRLMMNQYEEEMKKAAKFLEKILEEKEKSIVSNQELQSMINQYMEENKKNEETLRGIFQELKKPPISNTEIESMISQFKEEMKKSEELLKKILQEKPSIMSYNTMLQSQIKKHNAAKILYEESPEVSEKRVDTSADDSSKPKNYVKALEKEVSLDIEKSSDNQPLTVQYVIIAICEKVGIPYQWEKSQKLASPECRQFVASVHIKDMPAEKAITGILSPVGLSFDIDNNGLYLCKPMKNGAEKQLIGRENLEHYAKLKKYPFQDTEQWKSLSKEEQEKVIKGVQDLEKIEKALIAFWERNQRTPNNLEELCPEFLDELPNDPFATDETKGKPAAELGLYSACNPSNNGFGYYYVGYGIYDAWIVQSVILPKFESRGLNVFPLGICHPGKRGGFSGGIFRPKQ